MRDYYDVFLQIFIILLFLLFLRYLMLYAFSRHNPANAVSGGGAYLFGNYQTQEAFTQKERFVVKRDNDIYDPFYLNVYNELHRPFERIEYEEKKWIELTHPSLEHSTVLVIGCQNGHFLHLLSEKGYRAFGVDSSPELVDFALQTYPSIENRVGDTADPMLYDQSSFTHVVCTYFYIYHYKDKYAFLKNIYFWLSPGGYLFLHLVDPNKFDTILSGGRPPFVNKSVQKYTPHRILKTHINFIDFTYKSEYLFQDTSTVFQETFVDGKTGNIRQNEMTFFFESKETILEIAQRCGFVLKGEIDYESFSGDPHQFLIILERTA